MLAVLVAAQAIAATPQLDRISPSATPPGNGPVTLTLYGTNFSPSAKVSFGGESFAPESAMSDRLVVTIRTAKLTRAGSIDVRVSNPAAAGTTSLSNAVQFAVVNPSSSISLGLPAMGPAALSLEPITKGDLNNDGRLDIASIDTSGYFSVPSGNSAIRILLQDSSGNLLTAALVTVCRLATSITTADFNGDGNTDIAVGCVNGEISILLGDGTGRFAANTKNLNSWGFALSIVASDFNRDGHPDLAVSGETSGLAVVLIGDGAGGFKVRPGATPGGGGSWMESGDFNNDGIPDLLLTESHEASALRVLTGNGSGDFTVTSTIQAPSGGARLALGDFDGDGNADVAMMSGSNVIHLYTGNGRGEFSEIPAPAVPPGSSSVVTGDFNGDGYTDIALDSTAELTILFGAGNGTFIENAFRLTTATGGTFLAGDFNGDGLGDFALSAPQPQGAILIPQRPPDTLPSTPYGISDVCAPQNCSLNVLGNSGVLAGVNIAVYSGAAPVVFPQLTGYNFVPYSVNIGGVIAGAATPISGAGPPFAGLYLPGTRPVLENLNTAFGWTQGVATWVNDANEVAGYADGIRTIDTLAGNHPLNFVYLVNGGGIVLGADTAGALMYRPGAGITYLRDPAGKPLRLTSATFNSQGAVLLTAPSVGQILTPWGTVVNQPPAPGFAVRAFNSQGLFVGMQGNVPSIYTPAGGVVPISTLIDQGSGWTLTDVQAINDIGLILVSATGNGRATSLLLVPPLFPGGPRWVPGARPQAPQCGAATFNAAKARMSGCAGAARRE